MSRYNFMQTPVADSKAIVGGTGKYRFTVLADGLLRLEWAEDQCFEDRASVLAINRHLPVPEFRVLENEDTLQIITSRFHLTYNKKGFSPSGLSASMRGHLGPHSSIWRYGDNEKNLGGTARTLDNVNGRIPLEPGIVSRLGFAALDDSASMLFDEKNWLAARRPGDRVDVYLFAYGHDYRAAIKAFYALSGPQPLLPRWALGNWWSRYHAYSADEYLALVDRFRAKGIPLSMAVIDMDWHLVDNDPRVKDAGVSGWTGYTWNKQLFPDPPVFMAELHHRGLRISLNDHPADGVHSYEEPYEDMAKALHYDTSMSDPIAFDITNKAFLDAFFDVLHRRFEDQGVDLWWIDWQQGPYSRTAGIDPLWVLNHFHFLDSAHGGKQPMTFSRYAGPGSHRYPIGFSGDTIVTWDSLNFQPEFTATASNIGFGWWSHDIGGHYHGYKDDELLIRWVQHGVFSPILRLHSSNSPWMLKEPWNLDIQYELIMTDYLRFRHRLVPYIYTMNARAAHDGLPLIQPLYWAYPDRDEAYKFPNQYLFGSELIVAPITSPQDHKSRRGQVTVWLPPGRYVDIFTGAVYDGDRVITVARRLADYPVFAREGAIIPLDGAYEPTNGCSDSGKFEIVVVIGADGRFELVEDKETRQRADQHEFHRTPIIFHQKTGELEIGPTHGRPSLSARREWIVRLVGSSSLGSVQLYVNNSEGAVVADKAANGLLIKIGSYSHEDKLVLKLGMDPQLDVVPPGVPIKSFLRDAQIEFDLKDEIWAIVDKKSPRNVQVTQLLSLNLEQAIVDPLLEILLADSRTMSI